MLIGHPPGERRADFRPWLLLLEGFVAGKFNANNSTNTGPSSILGRLYFLPTAGQFD
jgi:hypothetical protein